MPAAVSAVTSAEQFVSNYRTGCRAAQGRAGQGRTGQDRTGQGCLTGGRARQQACVAGQLHSGVDRAGWHRAEGQGRA